MGDQQGQRRPLAVVGTASFWSLLTSFDPVSDDARE